MNGPGSRSNTVLAIAIVLYVSAIAIPAAFAYIDPGTGSYIFQVVVGALLAAALAVKVFWRRIWGFVTGKSRHRRAADRAHAAADEE